MTATPGLADAATDRRGHRKHDTPIRRGPDLVTGIGLTWTVLAKPLAPSRVSRVASVPSAAVLVERRLLLRCQFVDLELAQPVIFRRQVITRHVTKGFRSVGRLGSPRAVGRAGGGSRRTLAGLRPSPTGRVMPPRSLRASPSHGLTHLPRGVRSNAPACGYAYRSRSHQRETGHGVNGAATHRVGRCRRYTTRPSSRLPSQCSLTSDGGGPGTCIRTRCAGSDARRPTCSSQPRAPC